MFNKVIQRSNVAPRAEHARECDRIGRAHGSSSWSADRPCPVRHSIEDRSREIDLARGDAGVEEIVPARDVPLGVADELLGFANLPALGKCCDHRVRRDDAPGRHPREDLPRLADPEALRGDGEHRVPGDDVAAGGFHEQGSRVAEAAVLGKRDDGDVDGEEVADAELAEDGHGAGNGAAGAIHLDEEIGLHGGVFLVDFSFLVGLWHLVGDEEIGVPARADDLRVQSPAALQIPARDASPQQHDVARRPGSLILLVPAHFRGIVCRALKFV
ncbi:uncharacterized protein LOC112347460 [Selaginella moellendorffii]|uniref:uncharacterized protein LOC112347460 n=1 Tax=Selaginella moellendorffii TaxID=88036 RepID=UPI000D1CD755|nr:uncharacterized protein LOC112347460 [Selaginella moellendorffii]|eukprot:XP_024534150.1 uncharacterized protein LOC112347460 [Selaginella moellendorffii]